MPRTVAGGRATTINKTSSPKKVTVWQTTQTQTPNYHSIIINEHVILWDTACWLESHTEGERAELNLVVFQAEKDKVIPGKEVKANWQKEDGVFGEQHIILCGWNIGYMLRR